LPRMFSHTALAARCASGGATTMLVVGGLTPEALPTMPFPALFSVRLDTMVAAHVDHAPRLTASLGIASLLPHSHDAVLWPRRGVASQDGSPSATETALVVSGGGGNCFLFGSVCNPALTELGMDVSPLEP